MGSRIYKRHFALYQFTECHSSRAPPIKLEEDPPPPVWEAAPAPARTIMTRSQARVRDQTVKREGEALWRGRGRKWDLDQILAAAATRRAAEAVKSESSEPPALEAVPGPAGEPSAAAGEEKRPAGVTWDNSGFKTHLLKLVGYGKKNTDFCMDPEKSLPDHHKPFINVSGLLWT